jgi:hypothetical protein
MRFLMSKSFLFLKSANEIEKESDFFHKLKEFRAIASGMTFALALMAKKIQH